MIFVSKTVNGPDNKFFGVVLVGLGVSYFESIYKSITPLHDQSFALLHSDGTILIRYPAATDRSNQKMPTGSPWYNVVAAGGGHYWSPGFFDGQGRLVAVRPLHAYPLVINVTVSEAAALAHWYRRATLIGIGTIFALMCSAFLLKSLNKQLRRLLVSEAALARREVSLAQETRELQRANDHLDAALQNISQGLCMFDSDGRLIICNDGYLRMYNLSADVIKPGCTLVEMTEHRTQRGTFMGDPTEYDFKLRSAARNTLARSLNLPAMRPILRGCRSCCARIEVGRSHERGSEIFSCCLKESEPSVPRNNQLDEGSPKREHVTKERFLSLIEIPFPRPSNVEVPMRREQGSAAETL